MNIQTLREKYPQYNDLSDKQLADAIHNKFYSDIPINQFYAKIGIEQSKPQSNITSQPQQNSNYTQSQQSNNYTQPKITTNKPANTQSQIVANTTIKNNDYKINQADVAIPFLLIVVQIIFIFNIKKRKSVQAELYNREENTSDSYKVFFNFSLILLILTFISTLVEYKETHHGSAYLFFIIYQTWLIHKKNLIQLVSFTRLFFWGSSFLFLVITGIAIDGADFNYHGTTLNTSDLLFYDLLIFLNATIYYNLLDFFKNQVIIEKLINKNTHNYSYNYASKVDYSHNENTFKRNTSLITKIHDMHDCLKNICEIESKILDTKILSIFSNKNYDQFDQNLKISCNNLRHLKSDIEKYLGKHNGVDQFILCSKQYINSLVESTNQLIILNSRLSKKAYNTEKYTLEEYNKDLALFKALQNIYYERGTAMNMYYNKYIIEIIELN